MNLSRQSTEISIVPHVESPPVIRPDDNPDTFGIGNSEKFIPINNASNDIIDIDEQLEGISNIESVQQRRKPSLTNSLVSSIAEDISHDLHQVETRQEIDIENEITPFQLQFWKPQNIMSVEDTPFSNRFLVQLLVIALSIPGNLARSSMQQLTEYDNSYINYTGGTVVWVNFSACFVMSWCNNSVGFWSLVLENSEKTNMKQIALHTGITAGFCGSFSTLSSAMIEIFFVTIDITKRSLPNDGYRVMQFFAVSLVTFGIPIFGHVLGRQFSLIFDNYIVPRFQRIITYQNIRIVELSLAVLGIAALIANLVLTCALSVNYWYKNTYSFSILMGAFGAFARFKLSQYNGRFFQPWFPTGTLIANISGTLLISIVELLSHGLKSNNHLLISNIVHKFILNGFSSGFAGSLTTMSSFVNELYNLEYPLFQHIYFWLTFVPCFIIVLLIDGTYAWTKGFQHV